MKHDDQLYDNALEPTTSRREKTAGPIRAGGLAVEDREIRLFVVHQPQGWTRQEARPS
jgi:hypothetical protein